MDNRANNNFIIDMKKFFKYLTIFTLLFLVVFFLGPRPDTSINMTFDANAIPADVDTYLSEKEALVPNLIKGTEKEIIWADAQTKSKTEYAVIYLHGYSATKHEVRPVPDNVAKALGANLYFTRLKGHGRDGDAMLDGSLGGWMDDFEEAITIGKRLGEKIIVIATSNGVPISVLGMQNLKDENAILGLATISANFELQGISTSMGNMPWAETILPMLGGEEYSWEPRNEEHAKWWTFTYPSRAIFPMMALLKLVEETDKSNIKKPALFIYSKQDQVVKPEAIEAAIADWGGPTDVMVVENSTDHYNHVITGDILSPENTAPVTAKILEWAKGL